MIHNNRRACSAEILVMPNSEFDKALTGVANGKAAGENGVMPDMIKSLRGANKDILLHHINLFWDCEVDFESWHSGLLVIAYHS